jgi:cullin-associated NEDD8-dissociated protein 1
MLDREAREPLVDLDPAHGQLREPILKVLHVMRAMQFVPKDGREIQLANMNEKIGQMAFSSPGVFNYYLPEYRPQGVIEAANLVSPEAQLATAPFLIGYLNGMASLINYGLTDCERGFGTSYKSGGGYTCTSVASKRAGASEIMHRISLNFPLCFTRGLCQIAVSPHRGRTPICHRPLGVWHPNKSSET